MVLGNNNLTNVKDNVVSSMVGEITSVRSDFASTKTAGSAYALESITDAQREAIASTENRVVTALESICARLGLVNKSAPTKAQYNAAAAAGIMAGNPGHVISSSFLDSMPKMGKNDSMVVTESIGISDRAERVLALESYDEKDNRNALAYSITYNMQSARQDEFGETNYPTITIPADQSGISIAVNQFYVMDNVDRDVGGQKYEMKLKNLLRALADHTILKKEGTRAVPVYRTQFAANFVDATILAPRVVDIEGDEFTTSALRVGEDIDLLGISTSDALMSRGVQDQTDTLDPAVLVQNVYVKLGDEIIRINTQDLPGSNFTPAVQGDYKSSTLSLITDSVSFNNSNAVAADGTPLKATALAKVVSGAINLRLRLDASGRVNTSTNNAVVYGNKVAVAFAATKEGDNLALDHADIAPIVALFKEAEIIGWDPLAYRSNTNRRQQGQFIDVRKSYQRYTVPLRSPITARHPAHADGSVDASDVQALITATRIRTSNEAVTSYLRYAEILSQYRDVRDASGEGPDILGIGRHFLRATYIHERFDAVQSVDSIKSLDRGHDIQQALISRIRDMVYRMYRDSEYKAAADQLEGVQGKMPTVVISTDPVLARYLMAPGDFRTIGEEFNVRVVSTLDRRFAGKIGLALGDFSEDRNTNINPLGFGNLLWAPELVLTANMSRNGQYSRETLVQPRYLFINNAPIMGMIEVVNIPNVLNKMPLHVIDRT